MPSLPGRLYRQITSLLSIFFCRPTEYKDITSAGSSVSVGTPSALDELQFGPSLSTPSSISPNANRLKSYKKKALLVGIESINKQSMMRGGMDIPTSERPLKGPHKDIRDMHQFLIDHCDYDADDITVLIDTDDPEQARPTKENIEQHCIQLILGARRGERFFFHFAGHATQQRTDDEEEEDGKDEYILTCDGEKIQDNSLRNMLVDPLPAGASLVAVFDTCHSCTLLDLKHYRCNRVYVPWVNKGFRRTQSRWNNVVRRGALVGTDPYNSISTGSIIQSPTTLPADEVAKVFPLVASRRSATVTPSSISDGTFSYTDSPIPCCDSPLARFCMGDCKTNGPYLLQSQLTTGNLADVICLSSAKDFQRSWEDPQGSSLTQALIKILRNTPNPTIADVLTAVSHDLHAFYLDLHQVARQYKRQLRDINNQRRVQGKQPFRRKTVEMVNFQDPQISSHVPLDMKRLWQM